MGLTQQVKDVARDLMDRVSRQETQYSVPKEYGRQMNLGDDGYLNQIKNLSKEDQLKLKTALMQEGTEAARQENNYFREMVDRYGISKVLGTGILIGGGGMVTAGAALGALTDEPDAPVYYNGQEIPMGNDDSYLAQAMIGTGALGAGALYGNSLPVRPGYVNDTYESDLASRGLRKRGSATQRAQRAQAEAVAQIPAIQQLRQDQEAFGNRFNLDINEMIDPTGQYSVWDDAPVDSLPSKELSSRRRGPRR